VPPTLSSGRLQLSIQRGSTEQVIDGCDTSVFAAGRDDRYRHGEAPPPRPSEALRGPRLRAAGTRGRCSEPAGPLRLEPFIRRFARGASVGSAQPPRRMGGQARHEMQATLKIDESGKRSMFKQGKQIRRRDKGQRPDTRASRAVVSEPQHLRSCWTTRPRPILGRGNEGEDQVGFLGENITRIFGRSLRREPDVLIEKLRRTGPSRGRKRGPPHRAQ